VAVGGGVKLGIRWTQGANHDGAFGTLQCQGGEVLIAEIRRLIRHYVVYIFGKRLGGSHATRYHTIEEAVRGAEYSVYIDLAYEWCTSEAYARLMRKHRKVVRSS
jgi:hypothetical protein